MLDLDYRPESHDHESFLEKARDRQGFHDAYESLTNEYRLVRVLLAARQENAARSMETTSSAVSRPGP